MLLEHHQFTGTAFEIAGKGIADENSFRQAIFSACKIAHKRKEFKHLNLNPLPFSSQKKINSLNYN